MTKLGLSWEYITFDIQNQLYFYILVKIRN